ncbi:MAG: lytic transglycosylase domain-containing protein [Amaricoccus sp.]
MWAQAAILAIGLGLGAGIVPASGADPAPAALPAPVLAGHLAPRPRAAAAIGRRCTADGTLCIREAAYVRDVCRAIEALARSNGLDRGFFARLLWKESLFEAAAVSPAGAQGIAQFMPATAERRGLADAFNPAEALAASASYLADLSRDYGNLGLAAAAYNGGEARLDRFLAAKGGLPPETRAYVEAITGLPVETWRDAPPASLDLALAGDGPFESDCIAQAARRGARAPAAKPALKPWGVVLASNRSSDGAARQVERLRNRYAGVLRGETVSYSGGRMPGMPQRLVFAQVGRDTRSAADALCGRLRASGGACLVRRN